MKRLTLEKYLAILAISLMCTSCGYEKATKALNEVEEVKKEMDDVKNKLAIANEVAEKAQKEAVKAQNEAEKAKKEAANAKQQIAEIIKEKNDVFGVLSFSLGLLGFISLVVMSYSPARNLFIRGIFRLIPYKPRSFRREDK